MVRHLVGVGIGLAAVPVLLVLGWLLQLSYRYFQSGLVTAYGLLFLLITAAIGAGIAVLCASRVVSPVASLISGGLLFVLSALYWFPMFLKLGPLLPPGPGGFFRMSLGFGPTMLIASITLTVASIWPSRWVTAPSRTSVQRSNPSAAQEVHP